MDDTTDSFELDLTMRPAEDGTTTLTQPILGLSPYLLVQVEKSDGGGLRLVVESGGGVPQDEKEVVELLSLVMSGLEQSASAQ